MATLAFSQKPQSDTRPNMLTSKNRVFLTTDRKTAVLADSADAHFLLVSEGGKIDEAALEGIENALELVTGAKTKKAKGEK